MPSAKEGLLPGFTTIHSALPFRLQQRFMIPFSMLAAPSFAPHIRVAEKATLIKPAATTVWHNLFSAQQVSPGHLLKVQGSPRSEAHTPMNP